MKGEVKVRKIEPVLDYDGKTVWRCGDCGSSTFYPTGTATDEDSMNHYQYCSHCGKPIKWTVMPFVNERKKVFAFTHGLL